MLLECSNNSEILRTLRFGERVKSVRNEPAVNEITEDDVNDLSDQIRQLKVLKPMDLIWILCLIGRCLKIMEI